MACESFCLADRTHAIALARNLLCVSTAIALVAKRVRGLCRIEASISSATSGLPSLLIGRADDLPLQCARRSILRIDASNRIDMLDLFQRSCFQGGKTAFRRVETNSMIQKPASNGIPTPE